MDDSASTAAALGIAIVSAAIALIISLVVVAGIWKVFSKANQPGWASLIPIYNVYVMLQMTGKPGIWLLWLCIPFVNIYFGLKLIFSLARVFGKGGGFALGLLFLSPIFFPILGFGSARYLGPEVQMTPALA